MGKTSEFLLNQLIDGIGKMDAGSGGDRRRSDRDRSPPRHRRTDYDRSRRHHSSDSDSESPAPRRRNTHREPRNRMPSDRMPSNRMPSPEDYYPRDRDRDGYRRRRDEGYVSDDRHNRPRQPMPWEDGFDYGSGPAPRSRRDAERPRRREDYDTERPRRRDEYDDRYERNFDPYSRPSRRNTERPRRREDYYEREPYGDRRYRDDRDRDGRRSGKKDVPEWQRQAKGLFMTHAMPVIKKEGPKLIMKQLGNYMAKK